MFISLKEKHIVFPALKVKKKEKVEEKEEVEEKDKLGEKAWQIMHGRPSDVYVPLNSSFFLYDVRRNHKSGNQHEYLWTLIIFVWSFLKVNQQKKKIKE